MTLLALRDRRVSATFRGRTLAYAAASALVVMLVASVTVLAVERGSPGSNVVDFGDTLWWALVTVTAVGYGDHYPVTGEGRTVAAVLRLSGIALIGVITASLATWLINRGRGIAEGADLTTRQDIAQLAAEVAALRHELTRTRAGRGDSSPPDG